MPPWARRCANALPENHGNRRENGTERTSAITSTPLVFTNDTKRSAARLEWPIVNRSNASCCVIGLLSACGFGKLTSDSEPPLQRSRAYAILRSSTIVTHWLGACDDFLISMG